MRSLAPAAALAVLILSSVLAITAWPGDRGYAVAVFAPSLDARDIADALFRADAKLIDGGGLPGTVTVYSDRTGLPGRLRAAGALLVLNPLSGAGCAGAYKQSATPLARQERS